MTTITIDRAVVGQVLEIIEDQVAMPEPTKPVAYGICKTLSALREALNAPQPEPVRELLISAAAMAVASERQGKYQGASCVADSILSTVPPQPEPVAWTHDNTTGLPIPLYTHPPRREWVGLTQQERDEIRLSRDKEDLSITEMFLKVEAKLKERNHE